jgi:hypothetical protein
LTQREREHVRRPARARARRRAHTRGRGANRAPRGGSAARVGAVRHGHGHGPRVPIQVPTRCQISHTESPPLSVCTEAHGEQAGSAKDRTSRASIYIRVPIRFDCRLLCRGRITNWVPYPMRTNRSPRPSRIGTRKSMPKTPEIDYFCPCRRGKISPTAWWNVHTHPPVGEERAITNGPYRPYLMLCSKLAQDTTSCLATDARARAARATRARGSPTYNARARRARAAPASRLSGTCLRRIFRTEGLYISSVSRECLHASIREGECRRL